MAIGKYHHKVIVQQLTGGSTSAGSRGQSQKTWADKDTIQVSIEPLSGREMEIARGIIPTATHKVETYYTSYAIAKARLKFGTRYLNIESVQNIDERNRKIAMICTEEVT